MKPIMYVATIILLLFSCTKDEYIECETTNKLWKVVDIIHQNRPLQAESIRVVETHINSNCYKTNVVYIYNTLFDDSLRKREWVSIDTPCVDTNFTELKTKLYFIRIK